MAGASEEKELTEEEEEGGYKYPPSKSSRCRSRKTGLSGLKRTGLSGFAKYPAPLKKSDPDYPPSEIPLTLA